MKIGIEAQRANEEIKTGVEHYAKQLILHLSKFDRKNHYILYTRTSPQIWMKKLPSNFKVKQLKFIIPFFWIQLRLGWEIIFHPVDILFVPASQIPLVLPSKTVTTIHDVIWKFYPDTYSFFRKIVLRFFTWYAVVFAKKIITVSNSTKNDLLKFYNINPEKIKVTYLGYESVNDFADKAFDYLKPYVLFLSTIDPRKNLKNLLEAFIKTKEKLLNTNLDENYKLVIAGKKGWKSESIILEIKKHEKNIKYLGYVEDSKRLSLLNSASALVVPSFYEGFGMQILEGFSARTPVLASNTSSFPEIGADAVIYFNPKDVGDLAEKLFLLLTDSEIAQKYVDRGNARLANFSWEKCASETLKVLE